MSDDIYPVDPAEKQELVSYWRTRFRIESRSRQLAQRLRREVCSQPHSKNPLAARYCQSAAEIARFESRHLYLAYAFVRGVPYQAVEQKCKWKPIADKVLKFIVALSSHRICPTPSDVWLWLDGGVSSMCCDQEKILASRSQMRI